jgi:CBS domain-containing protein
MDTEKATVRDYMTKDVFTVKYDTLNNDVIKLMKQTKHDGYPVVDEEGQIVGIITAYDLLLKDWVTDQVSGIMSTDVIVAREDMHINDASRVMFRHGISRLPVVDKARHVKGIMTNTDIVRSHIERSTPTKVNAFKETMEKLYDLFGFGAYELFDNNTYEVLFVNTVSDAINDKAGWLPYFVWECECDFNEFNERVTVSNEHPNIKNFKDLYEFINPKKN